MQRMAIMALTVSVGLAGVAVAGYHPGHEPTIENAQVLPHDLPREQLTALMKHMTRSLGVRCSHCHVGEEGAPLSTYDFASDAKPAKDRARWMLRLTQEINQSEDLPGEERASLHDMSENRVTCYTCNRGEVRPATDVPQPEG